jgi:energy-coupling factor transporter ATP-binding protein EcfA2
MGVRCVEFVFRYEPGQWLVEAGGKKKSDFAIPEVTTLLLVGAMGAGKSTLVNNLIRVLNNKTRDFERAQVCGQSSCP